MKGVMKCLVAIVTLFLVSINASAQTREDQIRLRAAQRVGQMCDYISLMANPKEDLDARRYYKTAALNLFIERGEQYEEDGRYKKGVLMEVTSVNRKPAYPKLIKTYFEGLMQLKYDVVQISTTEIAEMEVSKLRQIGDNKYVCTCYFEQAFCGYRDGKPIYKDITRKRVKCYVMVEQTEDGEELIILLGDVTALDTRKL